MTVKQKAQHVFIVTYSAPGCVPDDPSDNLCFLTLKAAEAYVEEQEAEQEEGDSYIFDIVETTLAEALSEGYEILR